MTDTDVVHALCGVKSHIGARLLERYGIVPTPQVLGEIYLSATTRGARISYAPTSRREVVLTPFRGTTIVVVLDRAQEKIITFLPRNLQTVQKRRRKQAGDTKNRRKQAKRRGERVTYDDGDDDQDDQYQGDYR
jgi:hypothetical protein